MERIQDRELDIQAAALIHSRHRGLDQNSLASMLGVSQGHFSILLSEARHRKWLTEEFAKGEFDENQMQRIESRIGAGELERKVEKAISEKTGRSLTVKIAYAGEDGQENDTRLRHFGLSAGPYIRFLLEKDKSIKNILVAFGSVVRRVLCDGLKEAYRGRKQRVTELSIIPCRGSALIEDASNSSSFIASQMAEAILGTSEGRHFRSISDCPPVFPREFDSSERKVLKKYLQMIPDYVECYGNGEALAGLAGATQAVFSSLGPSVPVNAYTRRLFEIGCPELLKSDKWASLKGDLFGVPIADSAELSVAQNNLLSRFEDEALIGAKRIHLVKTIERGGIVLLIVALDKHRVPCLIEVCRQNLATHLLLDRIVAKAVLEG